MVVRDSQHSTHLATALAVAIVLLAAAKAERASAAPCVVSEMEGDSGQPGCGGPSPGPSEQGEYDSDFYEDYEEGSPPPPAAIDPNDFCVKASQIAKA